MPPKPSSQSAESAAPPPRGPHDHPSRPQPTSKQQAANRDRRQPRAATSPPHQRHGDRSSGDDAKPQLPLLLRYRDLERIGLVSSWQQLGRLVAHEDFPPGRMLSPNARVWTLDEVED